MINSKTLKLSSHIAGMALVVMLSGANASLAAGAQAPLSSSQPAEGNAAAGEVAVNQEHAGAQEHGEQDTTEHAGPSWLEYTLKWTNFVLLMILLYWVLIVAPPFVRENFEFDGLREVLGTRFQQLVEARDLAQQQQETARSRLAESAERLERVEQEAAALLTEARESSARDQDRLIAEVSADAEAIRATTGRDLDAEIARSRRALQAHVADLAVSTAKRILQDNFSAEDQRRLVRGHLDSLGTTVS